MFEYLNIAPSQIFRNYNNFLIGILQTDKITNPVYKRKSHL